MWVLAVLFWRRPRLAQNLVIGWLLLVGAEVTVIAPGQLYLRAVAPQSAYVYPFSTPLLTAGTVAGPTCFVGGVALVLARRRRSRTSPAVTDGGSGADRAFSIRR